jgi:hypothetical protein
MVYCNIIINNILYRIKCLTKLSSTPLSTQSKGYQNKDQFTRFQKRREKKMRMMMSIIMKSKMLLSNKIEIQQVGGFGELLFMAH